MLWPYEIGGSIVCFILSYIYFHSNQTKIGWTFLIVGLVGFIYGSIVYYQKLKRKI
jgi:hypothetical protein